MCTAGCEAAKPAAADGGGLGGGGGVCERGEVRRGQGIHVWLVVLLGRDARRQIAALDVDPAVRGTTWTCDQWDHCANVFCAPQRQEGSGFQELAGRVLRGEG